ncbi:MAG TPA: hypothetical protein DDW93_12490 [Firmicutes bacterium]|nr:hypothetical protein [Bacillota bacterium]HBK68985.1 hypothetical protein [Bacillota bacterium]
MEKAERREIFDRMASFWDREVSVPPQERIVELFNGLEVTDEMVIDIGTGTGVMIPFLLDLNPGLIWAVDISPLMLRKVREKYGVDEKIRTLLAEAEKLPLEDCSVQLVLCNGVYPHFSDKLLALREFYRVLKNGGLLIINHFIGREQVNMIHSHSEAEIIRSDLLETAAAVGKKCKHIGFSIVEESDRANLFRIKAVKI